MSTLFPDARIRRHVLLLSVAFAACGAPPPAPPGGHPASVPPALKDRLLAVLPDIPDTSRYARFSPGGHRVAFPVLREDRAWVVVDGAAGQMFGQISPYSLTFSPDGARFAYWAHDEWHSYVVLDGVCKGSQADPVGGMDLLFSPDGRRLAYFLRASFDEATAVIDDCRWQVFQSVYPDSFRYSPDGRRFAYAAQDERGDVVVVDGYPGRPFDEVDKKSIVFSPDGRRVAYTAREGDAWFGIVDGLKVFYGAVKETVFSPDGRRIACAIRGGRGWVVYAYGETLVKHGGPFEAVRSLAFNPDNRTLSWFARDESGWHRVVDGKIERTWSCRGRPVFSPDGRRAAFLLYEGDPDDAVDPSAEPPDGSPTRPRVVIDDAPGEPFDYIFDLAFTPDGRHVVYAGANNAVPEGLAWDFHMVLDGKRVLSNLDEFQAIELKECGNSVLAHRGQFFAFSPDGRHIACIVREDGKSRLVVDGRRGEPCDHIWPPRFTPDGSHVTYGARLGRELWCKVMKVE